MAFASLSIYGLYSYNDEIFANLAVPDGMDKDILEAEILTECSDFCLLYPNYDFMKMLIGIWSQKELHIWDNLWKSEHLDYNPIENYDRHETLTRSVQSNSGEQDSRQSASTGQGSRKESSTGSSAGASLGNTTGTTGQTAYDSDTIKDTGRSAGESQSSTSSTDQSAGESVDHTAAQAAESGERKTSSQGVETVTNHAHGNIGVTTAAQMIQGFRDITEFCTYDYIVQSFKDRFCVQVY